MRDRVPTKPGVVALTDLETGTTKNYRMTLADEPTEPGTNLNRANLLSDDTVAKIWPVNVTRPTDPSPSDALAELAGARRVTLLDGASETNNTTSLKTITFDFIEPIENFQSVELIILSSGAIAGDDIKITDDGGTSRTIAATRSTTSLELIKITILHNDSDGFLTLGEIPDGSYYISQNTGATKLTGSILSLRMAGKGAAADPAITYTVYMYGLRREASELVTIQSADGEEF